MIVDENKLNITIQLNGKNFPMEIEADDQTEQIYRHSAEAVNEMILAYKHKYDIQTNDILSIVAFHMAVKYETLRVEQKQATGEVATHLQEINHLLDIYLAEKGEVL